MAGCQDSASGGPRSDDPGSAQGCARYQEAAVRASRADHQAQRDSPRPEEEASRRLTGHSHPEGTMSRDVTLLFDMTDAEIDADLRADGGDPDAIAKRGVELVQALLKRKRLPLDIPADVRAAALPATALTARRDALVRKLEEDDMLGLECAETVELEGLQAQEIRAAQVIAPWVVQAMAFASIQAMHEAMHTLPIVPSNPSQVSVRTGEASDPEADLA